MQPDLSDADRLIAELPQPLAQLYYRVWLHEESNPQPFHDNAYYLIEAIIKLLVAQGVAAYRREVLRDPSRRTDSLDLLLPELFHPQIGTMTKLLGAVADHFAAGPQDHPLSKLRGQIDDAHSRDQFPGLVGLVNAIANGPDSEPVTSKKASLKSLLQYIPTYRNKVIGHAGNRDPFFYDAKGKLLLAAATELLGGRVLDLLGCGKGVLYGVLAAQPREDFAGLDVGLRNLVGMNGGLQTVHGSILPQDQEGITPNAVLIAWPGHPYLPLSPLLRYCGCEPKGAGVRLIESQNYVAFLNQERPEKGSGYQPPVEYLSYTPGNLHYQPPDILGTLQKYLGPILGKQLPAKVSRQPAAPPKNPFVELAELGTGTTEQLHQIHLVRQRALGSLLAVKRLRPQWARDDAALELFDREMVVLSRLDHPNIVRIIDGGLGTDLRPYYLMEFLPGAPLSTVVDRLAADVSASPAKPGRSALPRKSLLTVAARQVSAERWEQLRNDAPSTELHQAPKEESLPKPASGADDPPGSYARHVVKLLRGAALALAELHRQKVVHGNLRPGDFMLSADGERLVLTSLGKVQSMDAVGVTADVRALGVILNVMLTRRRFPESRGGGALLAGEPDFTVDRDLDAIVARAVAGPTRESVQGADELAENLQRYLTGQLLTFQKPTLGNVTRRWRQAHRAELRLGLWLGGSMFVVIAVAVVWVVASGLRARAAERRADRERDDAVQARADAEKNRGRAESSDAQARATVNHLSQISRSLPFGQPGLQRTRQELLTASLEYYQSRVNQEGGDPAMRNSLAVTHYLLGGILESLGNKREAVDHYLASGRLWSQISAGQTWEWWRSQMPADMPGMVDAYFSASRLQGQLGDDEAEDSNAKALDQLGDILHKVPAAEIEKLASQPEWSGILSILDTLEKLKATRRPNEPPGTDFSPDLRDKLIGFTNAKIARLEQVARDHPFPANRVGRAKTYEILANALSVADRADEARRAFLRAIEILDEPGPDAATAAENAEKAMCHFQLGRSETGPGADARALVDFEEARKLNAALAEKYYDEADHQAGLAECEREIGTLHARAKRWDEALTSCEKAVGDYQALASEHQEHHEYDRELAYALETLGGVQASVTQERRRARDSEPAAEGESGAWEDMAVEALETGKEALDLRRQLLKAKPGDTWRQDALANALLAFGSRHRDMGNETAALPFLREARGLAEKLAAAHGDNLWFQSRLAQCEYVLGISTAERGEASDALAHLERAVALYDHLSAIRPLDGNEKYDFGGDCRVAANLHQQAGETDRAYFLYQRALLLYNEAKTADPPIADVQQKLDFTNQGFSDLLGQKGNDERAAGRVAAARELYDQAIGILTPLVAGHPDQFANVKRLATVHAWLSQLYQDSDLPLALRYQHERLALLALKPGAPIPEEWPDEEASALASLTCLYLMSDDLRTAIAYGEKGRAVQPAHSYVLCHLACAYAFVGSVEKAVVICRLHRDDPVADSRYVTFAGLVLNQLDGYRQTFGQRPGFAEVETLLRPPAQPTEK